MAQTSTIDQGSSAGWLVQINSRWIDQVESRSCGTPAVAAFRLCHSFAAVSKRPTVSNILGLVQAMPHAGKFILLNTGIVIVRANAAPE